MESLPLRIEKVVWRGMGLARKADGQIVLVDPPCLPGELVQADIYKSSADVLLGAVDRVLEPSADRRAHPCPHAAECGGSPFGWIREEAQRTLKHSMVQDALARHPAWKDRSLPAFDFLSSVQPWRYRWRAQVHVLDGRPCMMPLRGNNPVPIQDCLLMAAPLAEGLHDLCASTDDGRRMLAASPFDSSAAAEGASRPLLLPLGADGSLLLARPELFFQANWETNLHLVDLVCGHCRPGSRVADLCAGIGNFTVPLLLRGHAVLAVEQHREALRLLKKAAPAGSALHTLKGDLRKPAAWNDIAAFGPETVVVDPPRTGLGKASRRLADINSVETIIWIACDPAAAARDLAPLLGKGWQVQEATLVDLFPQTWHVETVFVLRKEGMQ